jgi:hypothetical protein
MMMQEFAGRTVRPAQSGYSSGADIFIGEIPAGCKVLGLAMLVPFVIGHGPEKD